MVERVPQRPRVTKSRTPEIAWRGFGSVFLILLSLSLILFVKIKPEVEQDWRSKFTDLLAPLAVVVMEPVHSVEANVRKALGIWHSFGELVILQEEVSRWRESASLLESLRYENQALRNLLNYQPQKDAPLVAARVIGRAGPLAQELIIDGGKLAGIMPNMAAIDHQGLVGRVITSQDHSSRVLLISDNRSRLAAQTRNRDDPAQPPVRFLVGGSEGGLLKIQYLPQDANLTQGLEVVTLGEQGGLPAGLLFGKLIAIDAQSSDNSKMSSQDNKDQAEGAMGKAWYILPAANLTGPDFLRLVSKAD